MSRTASDSLHKLILSLTPAEKRYFKIFSSRHREARSTQYIKLFEEIEKQKIYDEAGILKKFRKEKFTNLFSIAKARLYESILRSLDIYHASSSTDAVLKRDIHYAEILYKRSLYPQCRKVLTRARKIAVKYERHSALLDIHLWEKKLIEKDNYSGKNENDINHFLREDGVLGEQIKSFNAHWNIKSRLFMILNKQGKARTKDELHRFKKVIENALPDIREPSGATETAYLHHHIYSAYSFGTGNYPGCYQHLKKNIALIEAAPHVFEEEPNIYFSVLTNLIYICSQLKKFDEAFLYLKKVREVPASFDLGKNEDMEIKLFSSGFSIELTLYNTLGDFEKAMGLIPAIEDGLEKYAGKINKLREAYFFSSIAVACFGAEKYSQALHWNNRILNDKAIEQHQDMHCFSRIFNLIIHLELKNESLLPYTVRSTHRYLKQKKRGYRFETVFLKFIGGLLHDKADKGKKGIAEQYHLLWKELKALEKDPLEQPAFEFFDFTAWAQSKAENRYFRKIIEEKVKLP